MSGAMRTMNVLFASVLICLCLIPALWAQTAAGLWEGEIEDPTRPLVIAVDFDRQHVSFSGGDPLSLTTLRRIPDDNLIEFDVPVSGGRLRFSGRQTATLIIGTVAGGQRQRRFSLTRLADTRAPADRVDAWRQDLDVVRTRFLRYDRSFTGATRAAARSRIDSLETSIHERTDQQILVELSRIVALSGNAHTRLYFVRNRTDVRRLPIRVWWFRDELRIVRAAAAHTDLLGCRILRVGGADVRDAFERVRALKAGNASWQRYMTAYYLTSPDVLAGAGVIPDAERVPMTVACDGKTRRPTLAPLPLRRSTSAVEAWWDLAASAPASDPEMSNALGLDRLPRYLRRTSENYWFEYVPEIAAIYVQYNRSQESARERMADFAERVAAVLAERPVKALVIDVRFNTGGNLETGTPLVTRVAPLVRSVPVFVLTGRATFSAGITHVAQWKQLTGATLVGEPVGDVLDFWSEGGNLVLPHSGLTVHYANAFHRYSTREYPQFEPYYFELSVQSIEPDVLVQPSWEDYIAGRDPLFEAVAGRLKR